jgi:hypothetical protein
MTRVRVQWPRFYNCMWHLRIAVGGDDFQTWRVGASLLNKPSYTGDKGVRLGGVSDNPSPYRTKVLRIFGHGSEWDTEYGNKSSGSIKIGKSSMSDC